MISTMKKGKSAGKRKAAVMIEVAGGPATTPVSQVQITDEMIAKRAYELSQMRGGNDPVRDWLDAEAELRSAPK